MSDFARCQLPVKKLGPTMFCFPSYFMTCNVSIWKMAVDFTQCYMLIVTVQISYILNVPHQKQKSGFQDFKGFGLILPHFQMRSQSCLPSKVVFSHPASENRLWGEQAKYSCKSVVWISHWRGAFLEIVMHLRSAFTTYQTPK